MKFNDINLIYKRKIINKILHRDNIKSSIELNDNIIEKILNWNPVDFDSDSNKEESEKIVWTMWWQGEDDKPNISKLILDNMKFRFKGFKVIVITKYNISNFLNLPDYVYNKISYFPYANLSDLIRMGLLSKYGGFWVDITIFLTKEIDARILSHNFYSLHCNDNYYALPSNGKWHVGLMYVKYKKIFLVNWCFNVLLEYWKRFDKMSNYLLLDYLIYYAYRHYESVRLMIDSIDETISNHKDFKLLDKMFLNNEVYSEEKYNFLMKKCLFYKVNYRNSYKLITENGEETLYKKFIEGLESNLSK